ETVRTIGELEKPFVSGEVTLIEALHFRRDVHGKAARVEEADLRTAAAPMQDRVPRRGDVVADGRHQSQSGNRNPARGGHQITLPPRRTRPARWRWSCRRGQALSASIGLYRPAFPRVRQGCRPPGPER